MEENLKQLLLKDLCARLPYGVYAKLPNHKLVEHTYFLESINMRNGWTEGVLKWLGEKQIYSAKVEDVKPYLRPMSSMTEEEEKEYHSLCYSEWCSYKDGWDYHNTISSIDWLLEHYFDFRGLIDKGLALEAPEGMYK